MSRPVRTLSYDRRALHRQADHEDELPKLAETSAQPSVVALQRQLGNAGVQRLIRSGSIHQVAGPDMVHRKGCGCASCAGERIQRTPDPQIQRFWGDDEETDAGDSGGSVWDSVTSAAGSAWDSASEAVGGAASSVSDAAGSAWDSASGAVSGAAESASEAVSGAASSVGEAASGAWGAVSGAAESAWNGASEAAEGAWGAVSGAAESAWGAVTGAAESAWGAVTGVDEGEKEDEEDPNLPTSGSVEAIKGSKVGMGSGCDLPYGTQHPRFFRSAAHQRADAQRKATSPTRPYKVNANLTMVEHKGNEAPVESSFVALDMPTSFAVGSNLDFGSQTEAGGVAIPGDAFGYSAPTITVDNIKWTLDPAAATISITGRIHVWVNWAIRSNDKTDVNTGNEDFINANNWEYVIKDLKPENGGGQPARGVYYSSTTTVKHELFHANEYIANAKGQIPAMSALLSGKTVNLPEDKSANYPSVIGGQVSTMMGEVRDKVEQAVRSKYNSGGEDRAYGDGKGDYNAIIGNIEKRAKAKGWPKNMTGP